MKLNNGILPFAKTLVCLLPLCVTNAFGQAPPKFEVLTAVHSDTSRPLPEMASHMVTIPGPAAPIFLGRIPFASSGPAQADPALQTTPLATQTFAPVAGSGFDGLGVGFPNFSVQYAPPDTNGAVGDTQYVQWVNASFAIFDKATGQAQGPYAGNAPWQGFGGPCESNNDGDPIIQFDKMAHRWIFTQFSVSRKPYLQCFAVSTTNDAAGPYNRFAFSFGNKDFPDYPKFGVWPDGYYLSFNIFANGFFFSGPLACAVDRAVALAGGTPTMICTQLSSNIGSLLPSDLDGSNLPPPNSPDYFVAFGNNNLQVFKFKPNFANPNASSFTGPTNLAVAAFSPACGGGTCIPQKGTSNQLDSLADRLMYRLAYRRFADGHEAMVVNHSIQTGGAASAIRWYELAISNQTPSVAQQGTYAPADSRARWMGSIAMDQAGNILVGYSTSGPSDVPGIRVAGRAPTDPAGSLQPETTLLNGVGVQTGSLHRWGDYSSMSIDPADDCTFWYTTEYLKGDGSFNWSTRIAQVKFSGCGSAAATHDVAVTSISAPASVEPGASGNVSVTVANLGTENEPAVTLTGSTDTGGGTLSCPPSSFSLNAGSDVTQTCTWNTTGATPGSHMLTATAGVSGDANSANNAKSTTSLVANHDVALTSISAPASVTQGASANVSVTVTNNGNVAESSVSLAGSTDTGGGTLSCPSGFSLAAGTSVGKTCTWDATGASLGSHMLTATASVTGDANSANNAKSTNSFVAYHDVELTSISAPASVTQGASANVSVTVTNNGNVTESSVSLTGSTDTNGGTLSCPSGFSLAAGTSVGKTCTWDTTGASLGSHTLTATTSVSGDANSGNNSQSSSPSSEVTAPAAGVTVSSINRASITAGSTADVTIVGSGFAAGATVSFENGSGPSPSVTVNSVTATSIGATISTKSGGPPRSRTWDVRVTNPDGSTGVLSQALTITP